MTFWISEDDHRRFIKISGDSNPLHADVNYCAKTPYETPVIHGVHLVFSLFKFYQKKIF